MRLRFAPIALGMVLVFIARIHAHLPQYSPFPPTAKPKQFPVRKLAEVRYQNGQLDLGETGRGQQSRNAILRFTWTDDGIALSVLTKDGRRILGPSRITSNQITPSGYTADLNRDGSPDYIVRIHSGSNGSVGGGVNDVVFVISKDDGFRIFMTTSLYPDTNDFLDLGNDGNFHFVQTGFVRTAPLRGKDGLSHNYWLYDLLKVEGSELKLDNSMQIGFPKWILFTFRANHSETDQLSEEQKTQLLSAEPQCIISTPEKPCAGYFR